MLARESEGDYFSGIPDRGRYLPLAVGVTAAFHMTFPRETLYRVRLHQSETWPDYRGPSHDALELELFEHSLQPSKETMQ